MQDACPPDQGSGCIRYFFDSASRRSHRVVPGNVRPLTRYDASKVVEVLKAASSYGRGVQGGLSAANVRGQAYLAAHQVSEAPSKFQKTLDHRSVVQNGPIGALAHLGLVRAYTLQGDSAKARTANNDYLTLWKDADPDCPVVQQAKAEYAKLK